MSTQRTQEVVRGPLGIGTRLPFDAIREPGCYVCNWSGHLIRVPDDAMAGWRSPHVDLRGAEPLLVTKISDNPFTPLSKARVFAAECNLAVNF